MKLNGLEKYFKTSVDLLRFNSKIIDFNQVIEYDISPLMFAFIYNKSQNLNLNAEQFDFLIKKSDLKQVNNNGWSPLMYALRYNKEENLNLSKEQWNYLIKNSDLKQTNINKNSVLMYALKHNKAENLNLSEEQLDYLIKNSDLKQVNKDNCSPLIYAFEHNKSQNLNLSEEQLDYLIQNSDLKQVNNNGWSPLLFALVNNKSQNLNLTNQQWKYLAENSDINILINSKLILDISPIENFLSAEKKAKFKQNQFLIKLQYIAKENNREDLSELITALKYNKKESLNLSNEQFDYLIKNADLKKVSKNGGSPLMALLANNKSQELNLSSEQFDYLIQNSDLTQVNKSGWSPLIYALRYNKKQNLNLNKEQWKFLIEHSDLYLITDETHLIELEHIKLDIYSTKEELETRIKQQQQLKIKEWIATENVETLLSNRINLDKITEFYQTHKEEKSTELLKAIVSLKPEQLGSLEETDFKQILQQADIKSLNMKAKLQLKFINDALNIADSENNFRIKKLI